MWKYVAKAYIYIKGSPPSIPLDFPHMDPLTKEMLLWALSPTLIPNYNNLEGECNTIQLGKGDEDEGLNLIDEHTKEWLLFQFNKVIDHCILMKCKTHMFRLKVARCATIM